MTLDAAMEISKHGFHFMRGTILLACAALLWPLSVAAQDATNDAQLEAARTYSDCMETARVEPDAALERARSWHDTGGGDPARHCEAVALLNLGEYEEAGRKLEDLAQTMAAEVGVGLRADALAQAGQAWMLADDLPRAEAAQSAALDLDSEDVELWVDRALTRFQMGEYWDALDDLDEASRLAPQRAEVYVYRASAHRHVKSFDAAMEDLERALEIRPDHPEALLERGMLHRLNGDDDAARRDWLRLLEHAPDSAAADAARDNLERMDVAVEDEE